MITIESDNPAVEDALRRLEAEVLAAGGKLSDNAGIRIKGGEMYIFSKAPQQAGEELFFIPPSCLLPLDKVRLGLDGDNIILEDSDPDVPPEKVAMFETLLEVYNLAGKIPFYRKTSPWAVFAKDAGSLAWFTKARPNAAVARELASGDVPEDPGAALLESYLTTRYLNQEGGGRVLMPFCDLANHHINSSPLATVNDETGKAISMSVSCPVRGSDECFVQYELYDALDLFILYGYLEPKAPFVRSMPLTIKLPGLGTLKVKANYVDRIDDELPAKFADLRLYLPQITKSEAAKGEAAKGKTGEPLEISHLFISGPSAPNATRRILANLITLLNSSAGDEELVKQTESAEAAVLDANTNFYRGFREHFAKIAEENPPNACAEMAVQVADTSLAFLDAYAPGNGALR